MTYQSPYGKTEGLKQRMSDWVERLSSDKNLPFVGLGLIADLKLAAEHLPDNIEPKEYGL